MKRISQRNIQLCGYVVQNFAAYPWLHSLHSRITWESNIPSPRDCRVLFYRVISRVHGLPFKRGGEAFTLETLFVKIAAQFHVEEICKLTVVVNCE
jgi:hypothetical protein